MSQQWYISRDGQRFGPYSWADLTAYAQTGRVLPDDDVWTEGNTSWVKARAVSGLFDPSPGLPSGRESRSRRFILLGGLGGILAIALIYYLVSGEGAQSHRSFAPRGGGNHVETVSQTPPSPDSGRVPADASKLSQESIESLSVTALQFHPDYTPEKSRGVTGEWLEQREVDPGQACRIEFSSPLSSSAENRKNISVVRWDGAPVETTLQINGNTLTIEPSDTYQPGQYYLLKLTGDLRSSDGVLLEKPLSLSFVTKAESILTPLVSETLKPSDAKQEITAPDGFKVVIPAGLIEKEERIEINAITGGHHPMQGLEAEVLKTYEIKIGEMRSFDKPLYLEIPVDMDNLPGSLSPEHTLKACYWDEALYCWVDAYALVDTENHKLIIPTNHLTKWSALAIKADGHIYNDYFSMYYSKKEMEQAEKVAVTNFTAKEYIEGVFDTLNDARVKYEQAGFRELEKIMAIQEVYIQEHPQTVLSPNFNVRLTGKYDENANRDKYTGIITIPVDNYSGVNHFQIAHELFHSVQNRYYYALGMTELGVPLTTAPSSQFLTRQWWLEGSADYAAGRIAYPVDNKPNPDMGGILNAKHLEKPLTHSPTALASWAPEDRHSYNNAWFFEYLVQEKKVDFTSLFETVASYYNPSVYSNLVSFLQEKNLDFNKIYSDYALWWFSSPQSPLTDGSRDRGMDKVIVMDYPANYTHSFVFPEWNYDNKHTTRAMKLSGKAEDSELRYIIVSYYDTTSRSGPLTINSFLLPENKRQRVSAREIASGSYTVYPLSPKDALYVLAVNNEGHIWVPEMSIHEADLTYTYTLLNGSHQFSVVGSNIPAFLEEGISIVLQVDGKDSAIDKAPDVQADGETLSIQSTFNLDEIKEYRLDIKIVTGKQEIIAQKNIKEKEVTLKINPPQIEDGKLNTDYRFELEAQHIPEKTKQLEFLWDMGDDGKESTGSSVVAVEKGKSKTSLSYRFKAVETTEEVYRYLVQVKIRDADTAEELAKTTASVTMPKPVVVIAAPRSMRYEMKDGANEVDHAFLAYVNNAGEDTYRFVWDFGDGSPVRSEEGNSSSPSHTYSGEGTWHPSVTLYSKDGRKLGDDAITIILEKSEKKTNKVSAPAKEVATERKGDRVDKRSDIIFNGRMSYQISGGVLTSYNTSPNGYKPKYRGTVRVGETIGLSVSGTSGADPKYAIPGKHDGTVRVSVIPSGLKKKVDSVTRKVAPGATGTSSQSFTVPEGVSSIKLVGYFYNYLVGKGFVLGNSATVEVVFSVVR